VNLGELDRFGQSLEEWFGRGGIPLWISEYAHQTQPQSRSGVPYALQAEYAEEALAAARREERVRMFVWFMLRDHPGEPWQSGLLDHRSAAKPAFTRFARIARTVDVRNARLALDAEATHHLIRVPALELRWHISAGERVGISYTVRDCGVVVAGGRPASRIGADGWVLFRLPFRLRAWGRYVLDVEVHDIHGFRVWRTLDLIGIPDDRARGRPRCPRVL
jgi:hypothetical protein